MTVWLVDGVVMLALRFLRAVRKTGVESQSVSIHRLVQGFSRAKAFGAAVVEAARRVSCASASAMFIRREKLAQRMFTLCLSCVLVLLMGCSAKRPAERADSSASPPTIEPSTQDHLGGGGTTETVDLWSDAIKTQLAHIAYALAAADAAGPGAAPSLADRIEMIDTHVLEAKELYQGLPVKVVALSAPDVLMPGAVIHGKSDDFVRRIRDLLHLTDDAQEHAVDFKLYGIERHGEQLKTKQRLTARGTRAGRRVESYAVVDATWLTTGKAPPRLVGFSMPKLFQVELISGPNPLFEDIARSVLGDNPAWREQLQLGMNTWARRIERSLKPDFLGYHGLAVADVDGDGLEDLYLCQPGGLPNLLFRQQADGKLVDISAAAGVDWLDNSTGALLVDLDNDGDADLAVATQRAFLIMENDGTGRFTLRTRLPNVGLGYSPTAADYDADGDLDILVLRYGGNGSEIGDFPTPQPLYDARNGGANVLLENQGNFRFVDVTDAKGMGVGNFRFSFAASWEDYDNDGDIDVYIANDFGPNTLLRNEGGRFVDVSVESGTQDWGFGMSATWADYDRDGNMDIYVSSMFSDAGNQVIPQADFNPSMPEAIRRKYLKMVRGNSLLRNVGQGRFSDVTNPMVEGFGGWAWGGKFADLNNDGWEDIYVANGYISQPDKDDLCMFFWRRVAAQSPEDGLNPTAAPVYARNFREINRGISQGKSFSGYERNALFLNLEGRGFADVGGLFGVDFDDDSRAVATVDWDRDGDLDMWVTNRTAPRVRLLRNNHPSTNSFVAIRLIGNGTTTNRDAIGARLTLWRSSEPQLKQIRTVHAGDGFLSQSSAWTHFGLGSGSKTEELQLAIRWPGGGTETFSNLKPNTRYTITQGQGQRVVPAPPFPKMVQEVRPDSSNEPDQGGFWVANRIPFPNLSYLDGTGSTCSTTDFLGKPVLINLWATWCAPCLEELSIFGKEGDALRARGATILALNVDGLAVDRPAASEGNAEQVLARVGYDLPHGVARQESLAKIELLIEFLSARRAPLSVPSSFLIDAEGNVAAVYFGVVGWKQLADDLALLNAPPAMQLARLSPRAGKWLADPRQVDRAAYLGDSATLFGTSGFPQESQRLFQLIKPQDGVKDARAYYNQAKTAAQQGLTQQAMEYYREAIRLEPEYGQALTGLGALLLMEKRVEEAQRLFEKALSIDPNHATALINLATIDRSRGDNESALNRLRKVIARNPDYAQAHLNLGSLLASMKKHDEAIQSLSKAVQLDPKMEAAYLNLAAVYMETQQWDKAEDHYRRLQLVNPRMAYAHFGLGTVLAREKRHSEAVISFRKAISLDGTSAQAFTQLGLSLFALGEKPAAVDALKRALELNPEDKGAKEALREAGFPADK